MEKVMDNHNNCLQACESKHIEYLDMR